MDVGRKVCACLRETSLRHLFNLSLYWFLLKFIIKMKINGIINHYIFIVVVVSVGGRVCAHAWQHYT